jgi:hypothetical protein
MPSACLTRVVVSPLDLACIARTTTMMSNGLVVLDVEEEENSVHFSTPTPVMSVAIEQLDAADSTQP